VTRNDLKCHLNLSDVHAIEPYVYQYIIQTNHNRRSGSVTNRTPMNKNENAVQTYVLKIFKYTSKHSSRYSHSPGDKPV